MIPCGSDAYIATKDRRKSRCIPKGHKGIAPTGAGLTGLVLLSGVAAERDRTRKIA
jgi:hypothetical protein